jgi:N-acetylglucosaminyl-diphospho-decaprenol L-rhamnosyltransferase
MAATGNTADGIWDRITVVLVTHNSAAILPTSLGSLTKARRIIVVDALSTDDTVAVARAGHPAVEVIRLTEDRGLGAATNVGIARADGDYVLNINPDTRLPEGCVERLAATATANANAAGVAPLLINARGAIELDVMGPSEIRHRKITALPAGPFCTWFLTGAVVLWRLAALRAIGGFDENIFLYNEDADLSLRAVRAGYGLILDPGATAEHFGGASEKITLKSRTRRDWNMVWGHLYYENKHAPPGEAAAIARDYVSRCRRESLIGLLTLRPKKFLTNRVKIRAAEGFLRGDPPWKRK